MLPYKDVAAIKRAYTYGYPIVGMYELLSAQILESQTGASAFCSFAHTAELATPSTNFVPAPNNDTSYSRAWLDLREDPVVIETPDTMGRFFSIQLLDLFSETIDNLGKRQHGTKAAKYLLVGPTWTGETPAGLTRIDCKTTFALAFLRILIGGEGDLAAVRRLQAGFVLTPLSRFLGRERATKPPALPVCKTDTALHFFQTLNRVLALTPVPAEDAEFLAGLSEIGLAPGGAAAQLEALPEVELEAAVGAAREEIDRAGLDFGEAVNHWRVAVDGIGNYGTAYFQRAVVWYKGALANRPEESFYPSSFRDSKGRFLDGAHRYCLHFTKAGLPPVSQFWSLTLYRFSDGLLVENELARYSIGDRTQGLHMDEAGGLTIFIQAEAPAEAAALANWLPAPRESFFLTLRLYGPSSDALEGRWKPPVIERVD